MPTYHSRQGVTSRMRMRGHDYASAASYFITLCTQDRVCLFGDVHDGMMHHSPAGVVIDSWWHTIPARFPSIELDAMVLMPNHLHGLIHLGTDPTVPEIPPLDSVMHWFKVRTTYDYTLGVKMEYWPRFPGKLWQAKYYDHIIRSKRELDRVRTYIEGNPWRWAEDEYHKSNSV